MVATTIFEDVRMRSGASVGSIYHHFGSKEGIAGALYLAGMRVTRPAPLDALRAGGLRGSSAHT